MTCSPEPQGLSEFIGAPIGIWDEEWRIQTETQTLFKTSKEHWEISTADWTRTGKASAAERVASMVCRAVEEIKALMERQQEARYRPSERTISLCRAAPSNK
jgi:hypothetical protein